MASGQTAIYQVLDSSWVRTAKEDFYPSFSFYLLGNDNDIVALRAQSARSATMVIWDVTGHRQLAKQTLPASADRYGNFDLPYIVPSHDRHKFALNAPGRPLEIWDAVSGQKLAICQGLLPAAPQNFVEL